jgi:tricorn protease
MVIFTYRVRLIDGSMFMLPRTGVFTAKGVNMEREGVVPDVLVDVTPEQAAKGIDPQVEKAVEVLRGDVLVWQKNRANGAPRTDATAATTTPGPAAAPGGQN